MLVLELCPRGDLKAFLAAAMRSGTAVMPGALLRFGREVAQALHFLEAHNILHRDIAARNVLLTEDATCKLADFGLARDVVKKDYYRLNAASAPIPRAVDGTRGAEPRDVQPGGGAVVLWRPAVGDFRAGSTAVRHPPDARAATAPGRRPPAPGPAPLPDPCLHAHAAVLGTRSRRAAALWHHHSSPATGGGRIVPNVWPRGLTVRGNIYVNFT